MRRLTAAFLASALAFTPVLAQNGLPGGPGAQIPNSSGSGGGGGAVSSVSGGCGVSVTPTTGATVVSANFTARNNTATTDTLLGSDCGTVVTESNASAVAVGIAQAGTTGFASGYYTTVKNKGVGLVTITPTTSTIDGAATLTLAQNQSVDLYSDGTNYVTLPGRPPANSTLTIASGSTASLSTSAIASAACGAALSITASGVLATDVLTASFNGNPTAVTGYIPSVSGMLTIFVWPTSGNVNFQACNNTASSITPGAITLNWRVVR